jgi:hypothetical protein
MARSRFTPWCGVALALSLLPLAIAQDPVPTFGVTVVIPSGLEGRIYYLPRNAKKLPDFRKMKSRGTIYTTSLNISPQNFLQGFPGVTKRFEWFAIDYTGRFWIEHSGQYRFSLTSDDGANLYIDDTMVIENDGVHAPIEKEAEAELATGLHRLRVSYFQGPREEVALILKVAAPGEEFRVFRTDDFGRPSDTPGTANDNTTSAK